MLGALLRPDPCADEVEAPHLRLLELSHRLPIEQLARARQRFVHIAHIHRIGAVAAEGKHGAAFNAPVDAGEQHLGVPAQPATRSARTPATT